MRNDDTRGEPTVQGCVCVRAAAAQPSETELSLMRLLAWCVLADEQAMETSRGTPRRVLSPTGCLRPMHAFLSSCNGPHIRDPSGASVGQVDWVYTTWRKEPGGGGYCLGAGGGGAGRHYCSGSCVSWISGSQNVHSDEISKL